MSKKMTVFGSYIVDLTSFADHLPGPGETVFGTRFKMGPGGKGSNQAIAAHRAGGQVTMVTKVGADAFADEARAFYQQEGLSTDYFFTDPDSTTGTALICVDERSAQNLILVVPGACLHFSHEDIEAITPVIEQSDLLLCQFEVNLDALEQVLLIARANQVRVILNPAPVREAPMSLLAMADVITPNEVEAGGLSGIAVRTAADAAEAAAFFHRGGVQNVVITMGKAGVFVSDGVQSRMVPSYAVNAVDTTGAGDAFNGAFTVALAEGLDLFAAAEFGCRAAAISVTRFGTAPSMPIRAEIDAFLQTGDQGRTAPHS